MAVPFGFSVGDLIAGMGLIKSSIEAFSSTRGATKEHKLLSKTLSRLCDVLEEVRAVETDLVHDARQREALRQAVINCQGCVDDFLERMTKYKCLQSNKRRNYGVGGSRLRQGRYSGHSVSKEMLQGSEMIFSYNLIPSACY